MKRVMALILTVVMVFSVSTSTFSKEKTNIKISLNGETLSFSTGQPYVKDGYTMVPIRELAEKVGLTVIWEAPTIILKNDQYGVVFTYDCTKASDYDIGKSPVAIDIIDGVSYAPLRFICESIGETVSYDADKAAVTISIRKTSDDGEDTSKISDNSEDTVKISFSDAEDASSNFNEKLNQQMPTDKNYMFSPFSIKMALAMAANGASGATQKEILYTTGIADLDKYNAVAKRFINKYSQNEDGNSEYGDVWLDHVILNVANSIWLNTDYYKNVEFSSAYQKTIQDDYDGQITKVDPKNAVASINSWVSQKTNQKITQIASDSDFLAALVNTTYFKGQWGSIFESYDTKEGVFTDRNGKLNHIDFMNQTWYFNYCDSDGVQMVRMPYQGSKFSMYIALSDDRTKNFEKNIANMTEKRVTIHMPKFHTEYSTSLKDVLPKLGIKTAFDTENADFKSMFTTISQNAFISDVLHKSYINVDELGTEAAAAAAVEIGTSGVWIDETKPIEFNANKPFTYFIRDDESGEILFMGEYAFAK